MADSAYDRLRDNLFVDIDYPPEITDLIGIAEPWRQFCALPKETKEKFAFMDHQQDADPGYRFRSKVEGREDKEYFHIYPNMFDLVEKDGNQTLLDENPSLKTFFTYAEQVRSASHAFALEIGKKLGEKSPELLTLIEAGKLRSVLRLLHYTNDDQADIIAAQHFDRSLYTLHLYESADGLQFMDWDMAWSDAPIDIGKTVVFSGYRLEQLTKGDIQKTWHRVVRKDDTKDRISMVLFVWTDEIPDYPREARSQDMEPSYIRRQD